MAQPSDRPGALKPYSNAHTVVLLEQLRDHGHEIYELIAKLARAK